MNRVMHNAVRHPIAVAGVTALLMAGPVTGAPWWVPFAVAIALYLFVVHTADVWTTDVPQRWARWRSNACMDCGHTYPATAFPGTEPRPLCDCCRERH